VIILKILSSSQVSKYKKTLNRANEIGQKMKT